MQASEDMFMFFLKDRIHIWWLVTLFYDLHRVISGILLIIFIFILKKETETKKNETDNNISYYDSSLLFLSIF